MKYVEFQIFVCRISSELYQGTKQEEMGLHHKIDIVLEALLGIYNLKKLFTFQKKNAEHGSSSGSQDVDSDFSSSEDV